MAEQKDTGFKITDRRKFNADGSPRDGADEQPEQVKVEQTPEAPEANNNVISFPSEPQGSSVSGDARAAESTDKPPGAVREEPANPAYQQIEQAYDEERGATPSDVPEATFVGLLNMLALETELSLGLIAQQGQEPLEVNLEAARQLIDTLGMLKNKTRGNLNAQEQNLLDEILAYLRMQFVEVSRGR
jgi:hypothetical protein